MTTPIYTSSPQRRRSTYADEYTSPLSSVLGAVAEDAWRFSPLSSIGRSEALNRAQGQKALTDEAQLAVSKIRRPVDQREIRDNPKNYRLVPGTGFGDVVTYENFVGAEQFPTVYERDAKILTTEDAKGMAERAGVKIKIPAEGTTDIAMEILIKRKQDEVRIKEVLARSGGGFFPGAAKLGVGLAVTMIDPLNVASAFIPVVGQARFARMLASKSGRWGRAGVRARIGAQEGAVGAVVVEPIILSAAAEEQAEYGLMDSLLNVAFGTALGGGIHSGIGAIADADGKFRIRDAVSRAMDEAGHEYREASLRASLSQLVDDRYVDIGEVVGTFTPVRMVERRVYVPGREAEAVSAPVREAAWEIDKEVVGRFEALDQQKVVIREQIAELEPHREAVREEVVRPIDEEVSDILLQLDPEAKYPLSAKKKRQLDKRFSELVEERERFFLEKAPEDTNAIAALRRKLVGLDVEMRDMAPEFSRVMKEARARTDTAGSTVDGDIAPSFEVTKAWEVNRDFDMAEAARATRGPQSDRFASTSAADEATIRINEAAGKGGDPIAAIDDDITVAQETLNELYERTGLTEEDLMVDGDDTLSVARAEEVIAEVDEVNKASEMYAQCRLRIG